MLLQEIKRFANERGQVRGEPPAAWMLMIFCCGIWRVLDFKHGRLLFLQHIGEVLDPQALFFTHVPFHLPPVGFQQVCTVMLWSLQHLVNAVQGHLQPPEQPNQAGIFNLIGMVVAKRDWGSTSTGFSNPMLS